MVQKGFDSAEFKLIDAMSLSPIRDKKKLHWKLYYQMISNCMEIIKMEDVFSVFL